MSYVIRNADENTYYRFMELSKPVCGLGEDVYVCAEQSQASKICGQLATFKGVEWEAVKLIDPNELIAAVGTHKETAEKMFCHASTIGNWKKKGRISLSYLAAAAKIVSSVPA